MVGQNQPGNAIRLNMELNNKIYGMYDEVNKITTLFRDKQEVENYFKDHGCICSCYNPPYDKWTTNYNYVIIPVDKEVMRLLGIPYFYSEKM